MYWCICILFYKCICVLIRIIDVDILEEIVFLKIFEGGKVNLDILLISIKVIV